MGNKSDFAPEIKSAQALRQKEKHVSHLTHDQFDALINLYRSGQLTEAEQTCRELLQSYPQSSMILCVLGAVLQDLGRLEPAVKSFDQAIQIKPDYADAYYNRGNALQKLGQLEAAVKSFDQAIQIKPDFVKAYSNRGNALQKLGQLEDAMKSYNKAIQIRPDFVKAYSNRGNALQELGQLEAAMKSYEKAIQIKPDFAKAYHHLSMLKEFQPNDAQIGMMESLFTDSNPREFDHKHLCFALAKVYEDLGEYDKSFDRLEEGNRLHKKALNYNIEHDRSLMTRIRGIFTAGSVAQEAAPDTSASIQPLFIVGMPRSGTSLVEQILASHSKVHGAGELETMDTLVALILSNLPDQNVSQNKSQLSQNEIKKLHDGYLETLSALKVHEKIITDKMPLNFRWIGFILSAFPEAKIIHVNRDPRATCWSIYKHYFKKSNGFANDLGNLVEFYKLYTNLMSFWRERFPNAIYDLCYEELTENQEQETRKLLTYCDLHWEKQCLDFHQTTRAVQTMSAAQIRKKMYQGSSEAWRKYAVHLQPLTKGLGY